MWKLAVLGSILLLSCHREPAQAPAEPASEPEAASPVDPAGRLPESVQPQAYALQLEIAPATSGFRGHVHIDVLVASAVDSILLHAKELKLENVSVTPAASGQAVIATPRPIGDGGLTALDLPEPVAPGAAGIDIDFSGAFAPHLRGLYKVQSGEKAYTFTQFEAIDARRAFPCFDEPRFKTPFDVTLRVPRGLVAIGNTRELRRAELPTEHTEVVFARTEKLPTYLVAFAVGPFDVVDAPRLGESSVRPSLLPLRGISVRGRGPELAFALHETPRLLESLERYFGIGYPYDKLDLIAVPDFAAGAMENAGAITFRDTLLLLNHAAPEWARRSSVAVNAHELAHQWFGNLVTMPWWDDIWLNEGFATWLGGRVVADVHPEYKSELTRVAQLERAFDIDSKESARQVRQPIINDHDIRNAFDGITYTKGAALLEMFERYLGPEPFRAGLRRYLENHRFGTGTSQDLMLALEERSGKPVASAFSTFLDQPGVPRVAAELRCEAGQPPRVHLSQRRYTPLGSSISPSSTWQVPVCLKLPAGNGAKNEGAQSGSEPCTLLDGVEADVTLDGTECPRWLLPNAHASGYYRWSLDDTAFAALLEHGYGALGANERLSLLSNTEAGARAGERSFEQLMTVTRKVGKEPERELVQSAIGLLAEMRDTLLTDAELPGYRRLVQELFLARQKQLGLFPSAREDGEAKLARPALVSALALEAREPGLRRELDRLGRAQLGLAEDKRASRLPSELAELAMGVAVQEAGAPVIERALQALGTTNDGIARSRLLGAIGHNQNPELAPMVLNVSLDGTLRTNERLSTVLGQFRQKETREAAYTWLTANFDALVSRLGGELGAQLTFAAGAFCSKEAAARAREFFEPRVEKLAGGPRQLRLNLESAELCAAFVAAHREGASKYFPASGGS
jgi:cytosol alanyl aminopeptidase